MAAKSLRCVVIAYKKCEMDKVLKDEKHMAEWVLPEDDLVWNAYVGIKVLSELILGLFSVLSPLFGGIKCKLLFNINT